jgi:hypothetical protein
VDTTPYLGMEHISLFLIVMVELKLGVNLMDASLPSDVGLGLMAGKREIEWK